MNSENNVIMYSRTNQTEAHSSPNLANEKDKRTNISQLDPSDELPSVATPVGSSSTTAQNVDTISETAIPPETQIPGENSNLTQMEIQNESNGSDTELFSDTNSNREEEPRSSNVGTTPTTDKDKSTNNVTTRNNDTTEVARKRWQGRPSGPCADG